MNVTQAELAKLADVPRGVISDMEAGELDQPVHQLQRCWHALGFRLVDVVG
jgi:predicted transcriptional regulator